MAKNHRIHSRPKHQTQTPAMSPPHAYTVVAGPSSSQSLPMPTDEQDEGDICPVCESECTCDNRPRSFSAVTPILQSPSTHGSTAPAGQDKGTTKSTAGPFKIKLTLPPSLQGRVQSSNQATTARSSNTKKSKLSDTFSGTAPDITAQKAIGSPFSAPGQPLVPGGGSNGSQLNADGIIPKKRGRPPKAAIAAREAAKAAHLAVAAEPPLGDTSQTNVVTARQPAHARRLALPKLATTKVAATKKSKTRTPVKQKQKQKSVPDVSYDSSSSELTEPLDDVDDNDDARSVQFPTFMSAMSSSSESSFASSSSEESDSDNETGYRVSDDAQARENARLRLELLVDTDQTHPRKRIPRNNWEIRPRKKSVGADGSSDAGMDADSDNDDDEDEDDDEEEDEADDEDEVDPGVGSERGYVGVATGWSDDDAEDSFDADLFFANLSDSTASDDGQMGEDVVEDEDDSELDTLSLTEAAAAGLLAAFEGVQHRGLENLPFEVAEGWDGQFIFTNGLKEGQAMLDIDFEISAAQFIVEASQASRALDNADIMMATSEEEEAVGALGDDDEDIEYIYDDSDGDTTEDEFVELEGVPTPRNAVLLKFPASMGAVNPLSTMSSLASPGPGSRTLAAFSDLTVASQESPNPANILAGNVFKQEATVESLVADTTSMGTSSSGKVPGKLPEMGAFVSPADTVKKVIVTESTKEIPSPFPRIQRLRRSSSWHSSKRNGSGSDVGTMGSGHSRPSSLSRRNDSPYQSFSPDDFMSPSSPELPPTEPIALDDVLDASFLEYGPSESCATEPTAPTYDMNDAGAHRHLQNLNRWDRIPMDTFRRTRAGGGINGLAANSTIGNWPSPSSRATQPADGFSYGSSVGGMMRGSPLSATLWEGPSSNQTTGKRRSKNVLISPVIFPVRDGDRTPTNDHAHHSHDMHQQLFGHVLNSKSRKELRKEKKRNRKMINAANAHHRQHYPNAKTRSSGSMQRSNFVGSSSMPPLSI